MIARSGWTLVGLLLALAACSAGQPVASIQGSPSTFASSRSSEPTTTATPDSCGGVGGWTQTLQSGDARSAIVGGPLAGGRAGFLALSSRWEIGEGGPRVSEYLLARSADGCDWESIPFPPASGIYAPDLITTEDGAFLLIGSSPSGVTAFRSTDGAAWEEVETRLSDAADILSIGRGPRGYLLAAQATQASGPSLWLSQDGLRWDEVYRFDRAAANVQLDDADGGAEGYVVLGRRIGPDGSYRRFALASGDGRDWIERPEPFGPDDQRYSFGASVTPFGPDWIATLGQPDGAPTAVRFSANGLDWVARGSIDAGPALAVERATLEETTIGLLFAPGSHMWIEGAPGAWISPDAASWSAIELPPSAWVVDAVESQGLVVLSGTIPGPARSSTSAIWVRATE
jgi:hypothetical protein